MMQQSGGAPSFVRKFLIKLFLFCLFVIAARFAYVVTLRGELCDHGDFCFFSLPENINVVVGIRKRAKPSSVIISINGKPAPAMPKKMPELWTSEGFQKSVRFYSSIFQDLISEGFLSPSYKVLCVETQTGADVFALKEIGVDDSIGIFKKAFKPLVISGLGFKQPFKNDTFDFVFSGSRMIEKSSKLVDFAREISRTLKPEGFLVVHTATKDEYCLNSFLDLFHFCKLVKLRDIGGIDSKMPFIREIVMKKVSGYGDIKQIIGQEMGNQSVECSVPGYKQELIHKAEPLIEEEPKKPWITLKKNLQNIKYLPSMADISFKQRYVYVDIGARSYGSSIVSWFKKQYPKQNKTFEIYAIEADKTFYDDYKYKKGVTLLPYAAWVRNETLFFEINNQDPSHKNVKKGRGMGRILPVQSSGSSSSSGDVYEIQGFDFAEWLKKSVSERDYVVMKMDVEGTEFDLIPRLFETGAICLIDEIFLECHYNRWQKCCPGERTTKYQRTYGQCLDLFSSLRESGVLVHQWW
ncbi:Methyltransf_21 domain-containing Methyltransf_11 domain-containing [Olea europaea subsp. europaea]|uniref:Methyltransf_21 domain-containing Methyltransf_11 domain-containing n=1 Tax=Olea europaea subsp. europaea TaxID=158383 RepID=A0A8S0S577_OLEEU|nr:Methyltransf_21 domain-containing Methyltransf_11 domain-containing [Olea europaea subsp. europaea]